MFLYMCFILLYKKNIYIYILYICVSVKYALITRSYIKHKRRMWCNVTLSDFSLLSLTQFVFLKHDGRGNSLHGTFVI